MQKLTNRNNVTNKVFELSEFKPNAAIKHNTLKLLSLCVEKSSKLAIVCKKTVAKVEETREDKIDTVLY